MSLGKGSISYQDIQKQLALQSLVKMKGRDALIIHHMLNITLGYDHTAV